MFDFVLPDEDVALVLDALEYYRIQIQIDGNEAISKAMRGQSEILNARCVQIINMIHGQREGYHADIR